MGFKMLKLQLYVRGIETSIFLQQNKNTFPI